MSLRKIFFLICVTISAFCLAAGYAIVRQWIWAVAAILMIPAWLFARKYENTGLPLICLLISVGMAVAGLLVGSPSLWMICSAGFALAVWDLLLLDVALQSSSSEEHTRHYENEHLQSLMLALGCGLFAILLGRLLSIQIPFIALILFVTFMLFALDRVWGYIQKTAKP